MTQGFGPWLYESLYFGQLASFQLPLSLDRSSALAFILFRQRGVTQHQRIFPPLERNAFDSSEFLICADPAAPRWWFARCLDLTQQMPVFTAACTGDRQ